MPFFLFPSIAVLNTGRQSSPDSRIASGCLFIVKQDKINREDAAHGHSAEIIRENQLVAGRQGRDRRRDASGGDGHAADSAVRRTRHAVDAGCGDGRGRTGNQLADQPEISPEVLHGLNVLWGMDLNLQELCEAGAKLGSDVPFCVMGQAAENVLLKERFAGDRLASHCALATGTGTDLKPLRGLRSHMILSKPSISVSTAKVYQGIDGMEIPTHPDTAELIAGLNTRDIRRIEKNMVNVPENYTLKEYPTVVYTKNKMQELCPGRAVLMSGSGPSVFGLTDSIRQSRAICGEMAKVNRESFWTRTTY